MIENGLYIIKEEYFLKFQKIGSKFKDNKSGKRPTFCCIQDKIINEIYWAIPTSQITEEKNMKRIKSFIDAPTSNIKSSFYHIGMTNKPCIFCIGSTFPIIENYIEREYTHKGRHLVLKNEEQNQTLRKKLRRILQAENIFPNRFEQRITDIRKVLIVELQAKKKELF